MVNMIKKDAHLVPYLKQHLKMPELKSALINDFNQMILQRLRLMTIMLD